MDTDTVLLGGTRAGNKTRWSSRNGEAAHSNLLWKNGKTKMERKLWNRSARKTGEQLWERDAAVEHLPPRPPFVLPNSPTEATFGKHEEEDFQNQRGDKCSGVMCVHSNKVQVSALVYLTPPKAKICTDISVCILNYFFFFTF